MLKSDPHSNNPPGFPWALLLCAAALSLMAVNRCQEDYVIDFGRVSSSSSSSSDDDLVTGTPTVTPDATETAEEDDTPIVIGTVTPTPTTGIAAFNRAANANINPAVAALKELEKAIQEQSNNAAIVPTPVTAAVAGPVPGKQAPAIDNWLGRAFGGKAQNSTVGVNGPVAHRLMGIDDDVDGVNNLDEVQIGTNPEQADSDGDDIADGSEVLSESDPLLGTDRPADSDGDGLSDAYEAATALRPDKPDTDNDGVPDGVELAIRTNPRVIDSDHDGVPDGIEISRGTDPAVAE